MSGAADLRDVPVDPRVERSRRVILDATLDEIVAVGYGALTIEGVARRANVGKATVYRHWDGKLDLVADAVTTLKEAVGPPDVDDPRERIVGTVRSLAEHLASSRHSACMPAIIDAGERDPHVRELHHASSARKRAMLVGLLDDAAERGHLDPGVDRQLLAEALVGPIFLRRLLMADPFPSGEVDDLVATVLDPHWTAETADG